MNRLSSFVTMLNPVALDSFEGMCSLNIGRAEISVALLPFKYRAGQAGWN